MIDPRELMQRSTVDEFLATAEEYYGTIVDPTPLMAKPFSFLHEAPEALQNLGLLLSGLHLGKTMTVLDFGAGTCWLSRYLTQLNCRTICCDVSRTALEIGRHLFERYPPIGTTVLPPTFLWFDGHRLDLPDAAVDRIICFDAFHHVPNPREVISELGRVLRNGGIAGFSEPGRRHSQTAQSQYEMRNHNVLENDIDLSELRRYATAAGFTGLTVKAVCDLEMSLDEYNTLLGEGPREELHAEIWNQTCNATHNRSIFFLHKGRLSHDSRSHVGLAHSIRIEPREYLTAEERPLGLRFTLTNTGVATWLHTNSEIFGVVRLGSHLYDASGALITIDYSRDDLPVRVDPGQTIDMAIELPLPGAGSYRLVFDLVAEGVTWFENVGSTPVGLDVRVTPGAN